MLQRLHACAFRDYALGYSCTAPFEGIENLSQAVKFHEITMKVLGSLLSNRNIYDLFDTLIIDF